MADKKPNPIAFNPDTMTVRHLKECADTLRTIFQMLDNGHHLMNVIGQLETVRADMLRRYGDMS